MFVAKVLFGFLCCLSLAMSAEVREIHDPMNIFCGPKNCYDVLGINRTATSKDIKKAFRRLSLLQHPDKNKEENATETFRIISKAYEVLDGNESRPLFDYYLDHPRDYFKVSGHHYFRKLPKSDVGVILVVVVLLISWFLHVVQYQKWEKAVKYLKTATINNTSLKSGGTKQTLALYQRAVELYEQAVREEKPNSKKNSGKIKVQKDDERFLSIVDQLVSEVKIEGGYRKPEWQDLFAVKLVHFPYSAYLWACKYHRRYISTEPLSLEDKTEMAIEAVGLGTWDELTQEQRNEFIEREIWKPEVKKEYLEPAEGADEDDDAVESRDNLGFSKTNNKIAAKGKQKKA